MNYRAAEVQRARAGGDRRFRAADVRDDAAGLQLHGGQPAQIFFQVADRHAQEDEIGVKRRFLHGCCRRVDDAAGEIPFDRRLPVGMPDDAHSRFSLETERKRTADESYAEYRDCGHGS